MDIEKARLEAVILFAKTLGNLPVHPAEWRQVDTLASWIMTGKLPEGPT